MRGAGIGRGEGLGEGRGESHDPKEEGGESGMSGNSHSTGGFPEASVKHLRTSANPGLSSGFFARHRSTMSQAG